MAPNDITALFGNLLENAVEAAKILPSLMWNCTWAVLRGQTCFCP
ncbi:GHKL domain-containing protein [Acutalibacter muris]|uniref:GHKL domain-containing protein n=1 Tax=Acutalibacter muris TaxID=1796620 RepID=A0A1Z2XUW0_9FIRM|nr:hypothetical protein A4V00_19740 [Hungateiclostridiaceae bacterium KB18]ASB42236.1 hypothetical protein ADH66_17185 [Acutalibacter muris]QQR32032.1 GHKL domain-containing protein [Acutalibacter muris]